jgi:hypothetical protein
VHRDLNELDNACTMPFRSPAQRRSWRSCRMITAFVCCKMRMMDCHEPDVTLERTVSLRTEQLHVINCVHKVCAVLNNCPSQSLQTAGKMRVVLSSCRVPRSCTSMILFYRFAPSIARPYFRCLRPMDIRASAVATHI